MLLDCIKNARDKELEYKFQGTVWKAGRCRFWDYKNSKSLKERIMSIHTKRGRFSESGMY